MSESVNENLNPEMNEAEIAAEQSSFEGKISITPSVIEQLVSTALAGVEGVMPANPGLFDRLWGKDSVAVDVSGEETPLITVDLKVSVQYGKRIPDVCEVVQEAVKNQIELYTGYTTKAVNISVQGIIFPDNTETAEDKSSPVSEEA